MQAWLFRLLLFGTLIGVVTPVHAEIFSYRDETGQLHFVDDASKVPGAYRDHVKSIDNGEDALGTFDTFDIPSARPAREPEPLPKISEEDDAPEEYATPIRIEDNRILVPVEVALGNRTVELFLLLDTGATTTVLHRSSLSALDLPSGRRYKARVAGGGIVRSNKIRFRQITIGPFQIEKAHAMVINLKGRELPFDGMLGMDFLKAHPYQVDFDQELIRWQPLD